jgi:protein-tyrosine-phosphatase
MAKEEFYAATDLSAKAALQALHAEFDGVHPPERIDALFADSVEQIGGGANVESYIPILAGRLCRDRLRALAQSEGTAAKHVPEVLFVGLHDSGRGQMAAALMRACGGDRVSVHSAGSGALAEIDRVVREALQEAGIDLGDAYSKPLSEEVMSAADVVVTMGRSVGEVAIPPGTRHLDWRVGDPGGAAIEEVRLIRDDIAARVRALTDEIAPEPQASPEQPEIGSRPKVSTTS